VRDQLRGQPKFWGRGPSNVSVETALAIGVAHLKPANIRNAILVVQHVGVVATSCTTCITFLIFADLDAQCRLQHVFI